MTANHYFHHSMVYKHTSVFTGTGSFHMSGFNTATCVLVSLDYVSNCNSNELDVY